MVWGILSSVVSYAGIGAKLQEKVKQKALTGDFQAASVKGMGINLAEVLTCPRCGGLVSPRADHLVCELCGAACARPAILPIADYRPAPRRRRSRPPVALHAAIRAVMLIGGAGLGIAAALLILHAIGRV